MSPTFPSSDDGDDDDLAIGAEAIALRCFDGKVTDRQVYRLRADGWPIISLLNKLAARPSAIKREIARREAAAAASAEPCPQLNDQEECARKRDQLADGG